MKSLVIVESPAKAKTISRFLGKGYEVEASFGHVRDLPENADQIPEQIKGQKWARFGVNIEGDFEPYYVVPESKKKQVDKLKKALKDADQLLLATDEDREGESISWHLLQLLKPKVPVHRIVFHEITPEAIKEALANPRDVDGHLVHAQESRRIVDRLYGYSLSPVLWKKVGSGLSAGRVQSVAVRLIVEREEERRAFKAGAWWDLEAEFAGSTGKFRASLVRLADKRICEGKDFDPVTGDLKAKNVARLDEPQARDLAKKVENKLPWRVTRIEEKPGVQRPAPPFTTSTLQQEANRKLGYGAQRTMRIAQKLYEGIDLGGGERVGLITYMRTDSFTLSDRALKEAEQEIKRLYGAEYTTGPRHYKTKTRNAQEAHEAIRPTSIGRRPQDVKEFLDPDEARVYELIWKRTIASQMADARVRRQLVEITATGDKGDAVFAATGKRIDFAGYLRAYVEGSDDPEAELEDKETVLPALSEGQQIPRAAAGIECGLSTVEAKGHTTTPPARYTEASLVKKLEEEGVGRPSTYATIISTIQDRGYVFAQNKALVPTYTAMAVTNLLRQHFGNYVDVQFTARMEEELDLIAEGGLNWKDQIRTFYRGKNGAALGLQAVIAEEGEKINFPAVLVGKDPASGADIIIKIGRYGPYVTRNGGGEGNVATVPKNTAPADFTVEQALTLIGQRAEGPLELGVDPASGKTVYAANGRFGPYVQLGEAEGKKDKPRRASLPKDVSEKEATLELALKLLSLPRELGKHPDSGEPIIANSGRYGPYVQHGSDFRSVADSDDVYTIALDRALELLSQPKSAGRARTASAAALKELGKNAEGAVIKVMDGRYGPYVTDGKTNATLPKNTKPEDVTLEQALTLITERAAAPKKERPARGAKTSSRAGLRDLGKNPEGATIKVMDGRYGAYVTDGTTNATLPKDSGPETVTLEQAIELLEAKGGGGKKKKTTTRRTPKAKK